MFGPNKSLELSLKINYHHREPSFSKMLGNTIKLFRNIFGIDENYEILLVTGSGTLAIESFIRSIKVKMRLVGCEGEFKSRWQKMLNLYNKNSTNCKNIFFCQLETSVSSVNKYTKPFFVDAVSSFPYYDLPQGTKAWVTVSSKILGAAPVLGIIVFSKDILDKFISKDIFTYLNIRTMYNFMKINQTHHTPAIPLIVDLYNRLKQFDKETEISKINSNCEILVNSIGKENIIGEVLCPVITVKNGIIPKNIINKYQLYGANINGHFIQIFTYSEKKKMYEKLAQDIENSHR